VEVVGAAVMLPDVAVDVARCGARGVSLRLAWALALFVDC
jgi:hypothetical protein